MLQGFGSSPRDGGEDGASKTLGEISLAAMDQLRKKDQLYEWCLINLRPSIECNSTTTDEGSGQDPEAVKEQQRIELLRAELLRDFLTVFPGALPKVDPAAPVTTDTVVHHIELNEGARPYSQPLRRMSTQELDELKKQLQEYIDTGRLLPSESP